MGAEEWRGPNGLPAGRGNAAQQSVLSLHFPLDECTLREAEEAAARFVYGPWCTGFPETYNTPSLNNVNSLGAGLDVPNIDPGHIQGQNGELVENGVATPERAEAAALGSASGTTFIGTPAATTIAGWAPVQVVPVDFGWAALPQVPHSIGANGATTFVPAGMVATGMPAPVIPAGTPPGNTTMHMVPVQPVHSPAATPPPSTSPSPTPRPTLAPPRRERWSNMTEDDVHDMVEPTEHMQPVGGTSGDGSDDSQPGPKSVSPPVSDQGDDGVTVQAPNLADGQCESEAAVAPCTVPEAPVQASAQMLPAAPSPGPAPITPCSSPSNRETVRPRRTWANVVSKELDATVSTNRHLSSASSVVPSRRDSANDESRARKDTIIDYLLFLSKQRASVVDGKVNGHVTELPDELRKFQHCMESGVNNISRAKYVRRGMKNDANNCYVNVVIQSLLPCSALMQLLSHCAPSDPDRPFYTGMVRLCKEFHSKKPEGHGDVFNVLLLPQVKDIINTWQSIGAQQDAGEFLFYMLNGMHEECKWKVSPSEPSPSSSSTADGSSADDDWAGKQNRKVEIRSAGVHEDSPIVRIFGGLIRSSVWSHRDKADSVSLEPFNHLILDISSGAVDSVWSALEAYCGAEAVNEGWATKRLQFKMLPKVLVVNLKRFSYNKDAECPQKIKKAVKYEEKLTFDRSWVVNDVEPPEYQLTAVICHHGDSANGGHYNAAVRYNNEWYMYDDALVRRMDISEVMLQQFTAYLLLYQCHDKVDIIP